jgi:hypothetical protein
MLRPLAQVGALAIFAVVVAVFGYILWRSLFPAPNNNSTATQEQYSQQNRTNEDSKVELQKIVTDQRLATYTLALAVFTGLLVLVSVFQIALLLSADKTATETAKAAKKSADAATSAANTSAQALEIAQRAILTTDDWDLRPESFGPNLGAQFVFNLINSGPTPAETIEAIFRSRIDANLPDVPDWEPLTPYPGFVRPNFKITIYAQKWNPISPANYQAIVDGRFFMWTYGRIVYRDIFKKTFELGFAVKCFLLKDQAGNITAFKFEIPQVAGYNYLIERQPPQ